MADNPTSFQGHDRSRGGFYRGRGRGRGGRGGSGSRPWGESNIDREVDYTPEVLEQRYAQYYSPQIIKDPWKTLLEGKNSI
ncbi:hypothetical protein DFQ28_008928 [Apophysomyces sp. BC1034]|nr:hypothetical protein DFQ30_001744 [Apophysomyces sp. BC1015]KAG0185717.1 hypothetical protein DFQ28_008928 [Apophysomyces sp. BC1034]